MMLHNCMYGTGKGFDYLQVKILKELTVILATLILLYDNGFFL